MVGTNGWWARSAGVGNERARSRGSRIGGKTQMDYSDPKGRGGRKSATRRRVDGETHRLAACTPVACMTFTGAPFRVRGREKSRQRVSRRAVRVGVGVRGLSSIKFNSGMTRTKICLLFSRRFATSPHLVTPTLVSSTSRGTTDHDMYASTSCLRVTRGGVSAPKVGGRASSSRRAVTTASASDSSGAPIPAAEAMKRASSSRVVKRKGFGETFRFTGWAPEVVNGRVAQIAFVSGVGAEVVTGETLPTQFHDHVFSLAFVSALVFLASFAPGLFAKKYTSEPSSKDPPFGPFTAGKELNHGRLAMVGLAGAFYLEWTTGGAFWEPFL